ncbi:MAG TPA: DegT/DnrJ/EryC1/StrS family aminotransferase [Clostridiales bacterium]|nr:DegT/DnrJ/EryC1/StrS family aminotransferase [Clostridiales bacterium]
MNRIRKISFSPPDISDAEIEEVVKAMKSGWITTGPRTKLFEQKIADYVGVSKAVCLSSATTAMEITLRILGVGPGDEVITSAYTYTASASVIHHVGAKIVFVDTAPDSYEMGYEQLAEAITDKTKVIIPVDIGGVMCDYNKLFAVVGNKKHLYKPASKIQYLFDRPIIMADAAHSFGATYNGKKSGAVADFSCYSFHAVKNLTTAEGGAAVWIDRDGLDNDWLYEQYQLYSLHGQNKDAAAKLKPGAWEYDVIFPAYKCNMTDLTAAFGLKQLERFDMLMARRRQIAGIYDKTLIPLELQRLIHDREDRQGNYHLYLVRVPGITEEQRNDIIVQMAEQGIACNVHFKPLPMMTAYKNLGFDINNFPNAFKQYQNEITLPLHTLITKEEAEYIVKEFKESIIECMPSI